MQEFWTRFESWLQTEAPHLLPELNPGATEAELATLAATIGADLPADFLAFYRIHNGQRAEAGGLYDGEELLSVARMQAEWTIWNDLLKSGDFADAVSTPAAGVRSDWWHPGWLPLTYDGAGNHWCLDLAPTEAGTRGQIIRMWHDDDERPVIADSFSAWMTAYIVALEAQEYGFSEDYDGIISADDL
jgi:cell wall assembly regulator SMI1